MIPTVVRSFFKPSPLLDQATADWLIECCTWAIRHFDSEEFFLRTKLIKPTNQYFPGQVSSIHGKAENIFKHTLNHTGLAHWPFILVAPENYEAQPLRLIEPNQLQRNSDTSLSNLPLQSELGNAIQVSYNPHQTLKAEDMASTFSHLLAQHLSVYTQNPPPGGTDFFMEGTEVLAIIMDFGILMANSAYTFRGGCGSCHNPYANRQASLSEHEVIFALAVFCQLKQIGTQEVFPYLKKHLKKPYKQALYQLKEYQEVLDKLKSDSQST